MKVDQVKKKYKNSWVLAEVLKENKLNEPVEVKPLFVSQNRNKIYEKMAKLPSEKTVTTFFTGKIKGSFLFSCLR